MRSICILSLYFAAFFDVSQSIGRFQVVVGKSEALLLCPMYKAASSSKVVSGPAPQPLTETLSYPDVFLFIQ
jgi:hypothetical protein